MLKVTFRQWGGFGGLLRGCRLDAAAMEPGEGRILGELVGKCSFSSPVAGMPEDARDTVSYEITVEADGGVRRLSFDDLSIPPSAEPLLTYLRERSRPQGA